MEIVSRSSPSALSPVGLCDNSPISYFRQLNGHMSLLLYSMWLFFEGSSELCSNSSTFSLKYGCGFAVNGSKREAERPINHLKNLESRWGFDLYLLVT